MGIFDEIGNDDEVPFEEARFDPERPSAWRQMEGRDLLRAERAGASATLVKLGGFSGQLAALPHSVREAWSLLNLDRAMRRILASAALEPAELLPHLIGGAPLPLGRSSDAASARFLLSATLPLLATAGGIDGLMADRLLRRLRPTRLEGREQDLWLEEQRAIDDVTGIAREIKQLLTERMQSVDPLFAITDLLATYGGALHGYRVDHLPDNSGATRGEMLLETYRHASGLLPLLNRARHAVEDGALLSLFDVAVTACLLEKLDPMAPLTGLIRRDLFRRDLHYPADFGSLVAALKASMIAATRDLELITEWSGLTSRKSGRVQLVAISMLLCLGQARASSIETVAATTWQGIEAALAPLERSGLVQRNSGVWTLSNLPERSF